MNSDLDDMIGSIAAHSPIPSIWDSFPVPHTLGAYQTYLETKKNKMLTNNTDLILKCTQSCVLACQVLRVKWADPHGPDARITVAAAEAVLKSYGIELTSVSEEASAEDPPDPEVATLVWPPVDRLGRPLTTTLPDVYKENYYHVREPVVVTTPEWLSGTPIAPNHALVLLESYWNEEALQWRMRFSNISVPGDRFWLNHCQVKTGDEIPKVIDASTQARNNDP